jgi:hypothetical protein
MGRHQAALLRLVFQPNDQAVAAPKLNIMAIDEALGLGGRLETPTEAALRCRRTGIEKLRNGSHQLRWREWLS